MKILFILETQFHFLVLCKPIIMTTIFQYLTTFIQAAIVKITEIIILDNTAVLKPVHLSLIICHQQGLMYQVFFFFLGPSLLLCFVKSSLLDKKVIILKCFVTVNSALSCLTSWHHSFFLILGCYRTSLELCKLLLR